MKTWKMGEIERQNQNPPVGNQSIIYDGEDGEDDEDDDDGKKKFTVNDFLPQDITPVPCLEIRNRIGKGKKETGKPMGKNKKIRRGMAKYG